MKIIFLIKSFAMKAGVERLMSDKMNYMAEYGYDVTLVTYEQGNHSIPFPLHRNIKHIDLNTRFFTLKKYSLPRRYIEILCMQRKFKNRLQKVVDEIRPDIIHTTTYSMSLVGIILQLQTAAKRTIESQVSFDSILKENDFSSKLMRYVASLYDNYIFGKLQKFDAFFALTKGDSEQWSKFVKDVCVIPNPLTLYPDQIKGHIETHHRIICAGRLNYQKGFDLLINAFAKIANQCPEWNIDIFGSGEEEEALRALLADNNLTDKVFIHPATDNLYEEFQNSDFFLFSSRFEGWGLVLVEAMSCGIPCVSFRCKYGPEDIITDHKDGLLVSDGNVEELGEKILWMINHPEKCKEFGNEARQTASKFKKDVVIQKWIDIFDGLVAC